MTDLAALHADLEKLKSSRRNGAKRMPLRRPQGEYRSDAEMRDQIGALETEIAQQQGTAVVRNVNVRSKGWS